jgi:membrane protein implicated in regulation of membrane protease activity
MTFTLLWLALGVVFILLHVFLSRPVLFLIGLAGLYTALFGIFGLEEKLLQLVAFVVNVAAFYVAYVYMFRKQLRDESEVESQ